MKKWLDHCFLLEFSQLHTVDSMITIIIASRGVAVGDYVIDESSLYIGFMLARNYKPS